MTQPSLEERWWKRVHTLAARLHRRVEGVAERVSGVTWGLQRAVYYKWANLLEDRVQSEPPVGDVCSGCGWTLTISKVPGPGHDDWWEAKCPRCDLFAISHSPTMAVNKFTKLILDRSCGTNEPYEKEDDGQ